MRINQFVARSSNLSRRHADAAIAAGRVTVNGHPAILGDTISDDDRVELDGQPLALVPVHTYLALHKPTGYVTSRRRQGSDPTIYELLPASAQRLRPAGRLDRDSSGLVLLSDDGDFIHRYTHPSFDKRKIYELTLSRSLEPADHKRLQTGVTLSDGPSRVTIERHRGPHVTVSLTEGRNRQLRRTFGALGYDVAALHRTHIGPYSIGKLKSGACHEVTSL